MSYQYANDIICRKVLFITIATKECAFNIEIRMHLMSKLDTVKMHLLLQSDNVIM